MWGSGVARAHAKAAGLPRRGLCPTHRSVPRLMSTSYAAGESCSFHSSSDFFTSTLPIGVWRLAAQRRRNGLRNTEGCVGFLCGASGACYAARSDPVCWPRDSHIEREESPEEQKRSPAGGAAPLRDPLCQSLAGKPLLPINTGAEAAAAVGEETVSAPHESPHASGHEGHV